MKKHHSSIFPYIRTWTNFWQLGMAYAFFWWSLFIVYCICYQLNRIRVYNIRKRRLSDTQDVVTELPGAKFWRKLDRVIRIPYVTEMISIKIILATTIFSLINLYSIFWLIPYEPDPYHPAVIDRRAAFLSMVDWGFVFFFAQRNSILPKLCGWTLEELIPYHRIISRVGFLNLMPHVIYRCYDGYMEQHHIFDAFFKDWEYVTGTIATISFIIMFLTSLEHIRRHYFEIFYWCHVIFVSIAIVFTCWHYNTCFAFFVPPALLWVTDRAVRAYKSWFNRATFVQVDQVAPQTAKQEGIVRIIFANKILKNFKAGQYVFAAMVLNGNKLWEYANWHPFTISEVFHSDSAYNHHFIEERIIGRDINDETSKLLQKKQGSYSSVSSIDSLPGSLHRRRKLTSTQDDVTMASFHIKALGTKTQTLLDSSSVESKKLKIYIDGLYGPQLPFQDYPILGLFATGIGATPAMAIVQNIIEKRSNGVRTVTTNHIYITWAIRVTDEIDPFISMFRHWTSLIHSAILPVRLSVSVYVTRMKQGRHDLSQLEPFSLFFGKRPDVSAEMSKIKAAHNPYHRVWVHVCGSTSFTRTVINEAVEHDFDMHHETFEF
ncbi:hypothetical protein BD408DRAFT_343239 [Parasitella parasitica]|nr:hypothetical protein BD408DRAFT_343239 [Parasitella parasitica]